MSDLFFQADIETGEDVCGQPNERTGETSKALCRCVHAVHVDNESSITGEK